MEANAARPHTAAIDWADLISSVLNDGSLLSIALQPIVDLKRGHAVGYEALARFHGPDGLTPDRYFDVATRLGKGFELQALAVERALQRREDMPVDCFLSINVSPLAVPTEAFRAALGAVGDLRGVVFELTEHEQITNYLSVREALEWLRAQGGSVAVDDAGAGYAGLKQLLEIRPGFIKFDRELVAGLHADPAKLALARMLGRFAGELDAWVIAEGIELLEELEALVGIEVPLGQGYLLGKPASEAVPVNDLLGHHLRSIAHRRDSSEGRVAPLVDRSAHVMRTGESVPAAGLAVEVDHHGYPMRMHFEGRGHQPTLLKPRDAVASVATRAMTRSASTRFLPLVVIDDAGRYMGIVTVERLVMALSDTANHLDREGGNA